MHFSKNASTNGLTRRAENHSSGADRVRTDDIQLAKLALSQLSYSPGDFISAEPWDAGGRHLPQRGWWA